MKRKVTVSLDEESARWARVEAARQDISVSRFLGDLLRERMRRVGEYEDSMKEFLARRPVPLKGRRSSYPDRGNLHNRAGLR